MADRAWNAGENYDVIDRFARGVKSHARRGARLLIVLSSDMDIPAILRVFDGQDLHLRILQTRHLLFDTLSIYESIVP